MAEVFNKCFLMQITQMTPPGLPENLNKSHFCKSKYINSLWFLLIIYWFVLFSFHTPSLTERVGLKILLHYLFPPHYHYKWVLIYDYEKVVWQYTSNYFILLIYLLLIYSINWNYLQYPCVLFLKCCIFAQKTELKWLSA